MRIVVPNQNSVLSFRAIKPDTGEEFTPATASWKVLDSNGAVKASGTAVVSGSLVQIQSTWDTLVAGYYYTIELTLDNYSLRYPLYAAKRWFPQPVGPSDFEAKYPHLTSLLPTGINTSAFLADTWGDLLDQITARLGKYPDHLWDSQRFARALELETVARIYERSGLSSTSADEAFAKQYRKLATQAFDRAVEALIIDAQNNALIDSADRRLSLRGIRLSR